MNKTIIIFTALLVSISNKSIASLYEINGAFGLNFGDVYTPTKNDKCHINTSNQKVCSFKPTKPYSSFSDYLVFSSSKTKKIFKIIASREMDDYELCLYEAMIITSIFEKKYAFKLDELPQTTPDNIGKQTTWSTKTGRYERESQVVYLTCELLKSSKASSLQFRMTYIDNHVLLVDEFEDLDSRSKAVGEDSGL